MADVSEERFRRALAQAEGFRARLDRLMAVAQQEAARVRELEAALRALTAVAPVSDGDVTFYCLYCGGTSSRPSDTIVVHKPDCPWVKAKALLGEG